MPAPSTRSGREPRFSALVNTLVMALVALLPGASLGQAGIVVAAAGLATTSGLA